MERTTQLLLLHSIKTTLNPLFYHKDPAQRISKDAYKRAVKLALERLRVDSGLMRMLQQALALTEESMGSASASASASVSASTSTATTSTAIPGHSSEMNTMRILMNLRPSARYDLERRIQRTVQSVLLPM